MKFNHYFSYIISIYILFIHIIYTGNAKVLSYDDKSIHNKDKYYLIYVNNTHGEYKIFTDIKNQKRQESQIFIETIVDEINALIINNKDTYQYPEKLDEIEENFQLQKRDGEYQDLYTYNNSDFVFPISSINDVVVLYAFLSEELEKEIKKLPNIISCEPNSATSTIQNYYNENDILAETRWKNMTVRENADFHLSLISQGKYDKNLVGQYDHSYYYPASAGKDIDIVFLDSSFHFNYSEFSNTDDRIVKCTGNIRNGKVSFYSIDRYCGMSIFNHGEIVADTAAGLKHGVANRANVYGVSIVVDENKFVSNADIIAGLQFIYENLIRSHKTVINISIAGEERKGSSYFNQYESLVNGINEKGGIIVSSAGNENMNIDELDTLYVPCQFDGVICVGGIENKNEENLDNVYHVAAGSNYGLSVDIYAPYHVTTEIYDNKIEKKKGTSFSSPLVAGMIATLMSENPEINYTKNTIYEKLYELGKSEVITLKNNIGTGILANNGKHIVYSEDNQYNGCGVYSGNRQCAD